MSFRDRLDVEQLLVALSIKAERRGHNLKALCPNPDHTDTDPSWTIVDAPGTRKHGGHRCFACHFGGGPWELVQAVRGVDEAGAAEFIRALVTGQPRVFEGVPSVVIRAPRVEPTFPLDRSVRIPSLENEPWPKVFGDYLDRRGVTLEQRERWHLGYATRGRLAWRIVIPVHTRGRLVAHVARAVFDDRERYHMPFANEPGARPASALFGEPLIDTELDTITIAEGAFSMLSLERAGLPNPVALLGSDWSTTKATILTAVDWRRVIIATDPDHAGDRVAREISKSYRRSQILRLRMGQSPDDCELDVVRAHVQALLQAA